jgi:hypothetical protein
LIVEIPFVGPSYNLESRPASVQRTINLVPVPQEPGNERTSWVFADAPGLVLMQDFAGGGGPGDWLGFNFESYGPLMFDNGTYVQLGTAVAFEDGVSFSRTNTSSNDGTVHIPFSGGSEEAPVLVESQTWFPSNPGDPAPTFDLSDPSGGTWSGFTWVMHSDVTGYVILEGLDGNLTVVTITSADTFYEAASLEYMAAATPPAAQDIVLPFDSTAEVVSGAATWLRFTLAESTPMLLDTIGSPFDTVIGLYTATGVLVEQDDESGGSGTSQIAVTLPAGTYYLGIAGYSAFFDLFGFSAFVNEESESGTAQVFVGADV